MDGKSRPAQLRQRAALDERADFAWRCAGRLRPHAAGGRKRDREDDEPAQTLAVPQDREVNCAFLAYFQG